MISKKMIITVTGPINSGKSLWAESLLREQQHVTYIATAKIDQDDPEFSQKIIKHKKRRPDHWKLVESSSDLSSTFNDISKENCILIDSLGTFVSRNLSKGNTEWAELCDKLIHSISTFDGLIILVIEEVGWGVVPYTNMGNVFRNRLSDLNYQISINSNENWLVISGKAINMNEIGISVNKNSRDA